MPLQQSPDSSHPQQQQAIPTSSQAVPTSSQATPISSQATPTPPINTLSSIPSLYTSSVLTFSSTTGSLIYVSSSTVLSATFCVTSSSSSSSSSSSLLSPSSSPTSCTLKTDTATTSTSSNTTVLAVSSSPPTPPLSTSSISITKSTSTLSTCSSSSSSMSSPESSPSLPLSTSPVSTSTTPVATSTTPVATSATIYFSSSTLPSHSSPSSSPPLNTTTTTSSSSPSSSITMGTTSPDSVSMPPDVVESKPKLNMRDELQDGMKKLRDMTAWSNSEATQIVKAISLMYWNVEERQQELADTFSELQGHELFINMLLSLTKERLFSSNQTWQTAFFVYNTLWNLSDASLTLALKLGQNGMIKLCTANISHEPYRDNIKKQKNVEFLIKASLNILHNLAKAQGNKHIYREEKVVESLEPFLEGDPYFKAISMMTLAYIVEEGQEEILGEKGTNTIQYLVDILKDAQNSKDKRCQGLSDREVVAALGRLAAHDNNKQKIVEAGGLSLMIKMLHDDSVEAQEVAAKALWNLAFSDQVSEQLRNRAECMEALEKLSSSESTDVAKAANGALWVINKEGEKKDEEKDEREDDDEDFTEIGSLMSASRKKAHIMISYQWGSQPLVLKMRDAISRAGYNVWVDVDCMYGSTLQAMAEAIENACAIVICMSERYKESPNCRTEAEYAFQLRKKIIPVMMEEYYQPDGWLGIILGAKFYMDFSGRLAMEEEMNKLLKEIAVHGTYAKIVHRDDTDEGSLIGATVTFPLESAGISCKIECLDWSSAQVQDWLSENELEHLRQAMAEYDGKLLHQLHKMRGEAPEFFYASIKEDLGLKRLIDILRFTEALDSLMKC